MYAGVCISQKLFPPLQIRYVPVFYEFMEVKMGVSDLLFQISPSYTKYTPELSHTMCLK